LPPSAAHSGRPVAIPSDAAPSMAGSAEIVVRARPHEARVALVRGTRVLAAWSVRSATNLGEIGLAELFSDDVLMVVRTWTETQAEQQVLRLGPSGIGSSFAADLAEWAQALPTSRFRLGGDHRLCQLRSAPSGVEVAAWTIGGRR
jgi:hypothetical protein